MIFLSQLLKIPVVDSRQEDLGTLKDVIVSVGKQAYPEVTGLLVMRRGKLLHIPERYVEHLGYGEITLSRSGEWKEGYALGSGDFLLGRDLLDQQIFDIKGIRVVRVNDLELARLHERHALVGIDVSSRALFKRLGLLHLPFFRRLPSRMIDWKDVSVVRGPQSNVQLNLAKERLQAMHPADIANLIENLNFRESTQLVQSFDEETAAEVLEEVQPRYKDKLLEQLPTRQLAGIVEEMPKDQAADVVQDLSDHKRRQVFRRLGVRKAKALSDLAAYREDTAGGLMNTDFVALRPEDTVTRAIRKIRKVSGTFRSLYHVFIVDDQGVLTGVVSVRTLLLAKGRQPLCEIMSKVIRTVRPGTKAKEVARVMTRYDLLSIAVVDRRRTLLGIVTGDDILRYLVPDA